MTRIYTHEEFEDKPAPEGRKTKEVKKDFQQKQEKKTFF